MSYRFVDYLQTCMTYTIAECTVNKLLMMDRKTVRNMYSFMKKYIREISASSWFYYKVICYDAQSHESKFRLSSFHSVAKMSVL